MDAITKNSWNCPVCMDIMDGEKNGLVAISKRCFHVFHKVCIENWINKGSRNCPSCRLKNISIQEIILNPDYEKQCKKYLSNPENYSYKKAFDEEYHHIDSTSDSSGAEENLKPQDILRPRILRGAERREDLNEQEAFILLKETGNKIDELFLDPTRHKIDKARKEYYQAECLALKYVSQGQATIKKQNAEQFEQLAEISYNNEHLKLGDYYQNKVESIENKIENKINLLKREVSTNWDLINLLRQFSKSIGAYSERFRIAALTNYTDPNNPSIEESRKLLKEVDTELDSFVNGQNSNIKEILDPPHEEEIHEAQNQIQLQGIVRPIIQNEPNIPRRVSPVQYKRILKVAVFAIGLIVLYKVARSKSVTNYIRKYSKLNLKRS